jgi:hypothetical protein
MVLLRIGLPHEILRALVQILERNKFGSARSRVFVADHGE